MKNILIVDDTVTLAQNIADILSMEGYIVTHANNGVEALEKLASEKPQLIITDIVMPEMNGFELIQKIRENESLKGIPIIMLSAAKMEDFDKNAELRPEAFLKKPCDVDILIDTISSLIGKYE